MPSSTDAPPPESALPPSSQPPVLPRQQAIRLLVLVCTAQVLAQIGTYTWPALLPQFFEIWRLSNSQAGWITAAFYLSYVLAVPILVSATDWADPRRIYLLGVSCTVLSHAGMALLAEGFWSAFAFRLLAGVGWAGTYMTGLKLLADRLEARLLSRATAGHVASIGMAGAFSFVVAGAVNSAWGWRGAFVLASLCAAGAWLIAFGVMPRTQPRPRAVGTRRFELLPVLRNRAAMAYSIAYAAHTWELNVLRGWAVAFLAYVATQHPGAAPAWLAPTVAATAMALLGTVVSVVGNELSISLGRVRLIGVAMTLSLAFAATIGFLGPLSYGLAVALVLGYGIVIWMDSSSLTAGAAGSADPARRGAGLAVHSMLGYGGGFFGPLAVGWTLDLAGGMSQLGWGLAFLQVGLVVLVGFAAFRLLRPRGLAGDRPA